MHEDEHVDDVTRIADRRARRVPNDRVGSAPGGFESAAQLDDTRVVERAARTTRAGDGDGVIEEFDQTMIAHRGGVGPDDQTRLLFRPRADADDQHSVELDDIDETVLGARRLGGQHAGEAPERDADDGADDTARRSDRSAQLDDATWDRSGSPRRHTLTGEPTQAVSALMPRVIEAPRRRANFADDQEPVARAAYVPSVIGVADVYRVRDAQDPLAAHIAFDTIDRSPVDIVDGAAIVAEQRKRSRRRVWWLVATVVIVWTVSAAALITLILL